MCFRKMISRLASPVRQIDRFLDGTMGEEERDLFEKRCLEDHAFFLKVQERELWRARVAQTLAEAGAELREKNTTQATQRTGHSWRTNPSTPGVRTGWAYALLAITLLSLCILLVLPNHKDKYAVHPDLERELGARVLRSATVKLLSPGMETKPNGEIHFAWESDARAFFQVVILDNQANEIAFLRTESQSIRYQTDLAPGLYYWKLLQNDNWIYTGKIIIGNR